MGPPNRVRERLRCLLILGGFAMFMASRDEFAPNSLPHLAEAAAGLWVFVMAILWRRSGSRAWWKASRDDE